VFLAKSPQGIEDAEDIAFYELRRVCTLLKTKSRVF